jgi:hypothetical protein
MHATPVNRLSRKFILVVSLTTLLAVLTGYFQPPSPDEGALAHIFQLSIVTLLLALLVFFFTADWKRPLRVIRELRVPGVAVAAAFFALYFLEHR